MMHEQLRAASQQSQRACRCQQRPFTAASGQIRSRPRLVAKAALGDADDLVNRREALLSPALLGLGLAASQALQLAPGVLPAVADTIESAAGEGFKQVYDETLAYTFLYPTATKSGEVLQMTLTHPAEKYSSAAPLTADARQRIVYERFDLKKFVTASMTVGPASGVLKDAAPANWRPKDVALTVLIDRSTARLSSGQRTALNDVEAVRSEERDGQTYWVYEHVTQGSPTIQQRTTETYRHALAVTAIRPGLDGRPYLYTLNLSCPEGLWEDLAPQFEAAADSFRLVQPNNNYIPPDQNPWLFF